MNGTNWKRGLWSGLILLLLGLFAAPEAFAIVIGIRITFTPPDPVIPAASTLSGTLQLYRQPDPAVPPIAIGDARIVNALPVGGAAAFEFSIPGDPIAPGDPIFVSFGGSVLVPTAAGGTLALPAYAAPTDPIAPTPPVTAPLVLLGPLQAGLSANVRVAGWNARGPFIAARVAIVARPDAGLADLVIDDFTTGPLARHDILCNLLDVTRAGAMAGATRRTRLIVNQPPVPCATTNALRQPASLQVGPDGPLVVSTGLKTFHRLELSYGQDLANNNQPLSLDLTQRLHNDRIRVTFDASDLVENFNIVLYTAYGTPSSAIALCGMNMNPGTNTFSVDFPFANFHTNVGTPDFQRVDFIILVLQSGSAIGANDFALRSVVATRGEGGLQVCG